MMDDGQTGRKTLNGRLMSVSESINESSLILPYILELIGSTGGIKLHNNFHL